MYRSRLGSDIDAATLRYVSSVSEDSEIAQYDIVGSQAHVLMLHKCGLVSEADAAGILGALEELKAEGALPEQDGAEDVHELVESEVVRRVGMDRGGRMHTARSRNDQVALDMRMKIRDDINTVCGCILDMAESLVSMARSHQKTVMPLYTHMQQAQAGLLSHYFLSHADSLLRDYERFYQSFRRVNRSPLGAGPVGGTMLPIDRHWTAKALGFDGVVENSIDATGGRDFAVEYVLAVSVMMAGLSRMAEDLVVWSTSEFSFVDLADRFASPSSIMPQKKNPDILELTRGKAAQAAGCATAALAACKGLASGYGRDLQQIKQPVWDATRMAVGALTVLRSVVLTMKVDAARMRKAALSSNVVALDIADRLVEKGVPFRVAHKITGALSGLAHGSGRPISRLGMLDIKRAARGTGVKPADILEAVSSSTVSSSLRGRRSYGSSGYAEQKRMISDRTDMMEDLRASLDRRKNAVYSALEDLSEQVRAMLEKHAADPGTIE